MCGVIDIRGQELEGQTIEDGEPPAGTIGVYDVHILHVVAVDLRLHAPDEPDHATRAGVRAFLSKLIILRH